MSVLTNIFTAIASAIRSKNNSQTTYKPDEMATAISNIDTQVAHVYGVSWDGSSSTALSRTDEAANLIAPNPYYSGMSGIPSSPFDAIYPWCAIRKVEKDGNQLVEIPKFWYKWTPGSGSAFQLQISDKPKSGFLISPAHRDLGNGIKDVVYVGRYMINSSNYKSASGYTPYKTSIATIRSRIKSYNSGYHLFDFAMYWTIAMLYLVEFANFDIQTQIAYGNYDSSSESSNVSGRTDSMPYHTGTMFSTRTTNGGGIQYRYIEDLWANGRQFIDGVIFDADAIMKVANDPSIYGTYASYTNTDISAYDYVGRSYTSWVTATARSFSNAPSTSGLEYARIPLPIGTSVKELTSYIPDYSEYQKSSGNKALALIGGGWTNANDMLMTGLFSLSGFYGVSDGNGYSRGRLMLL